MKGQWQEKQATHRENVLPHADDTQQKLPYAGFGTQKCHMRELHADHLNQPLLRETEVTMTQRSNINTSMGETETPAVGVEQHAGAGPDHPLSVKIPGEGGVGG